MMNGMSGMENMEKDNSMEQNKITNDSTQFNKHALKEKKDKMPFMRIGIGMGIMMTGMLLFLMN